jgi:hypothetical protein
VWVVTNIETRSTVGSVKYGEVMLPPAVFGINGELARRSLQIN